MRILLILHCVGLCAGCGPTFQTLAGAYQDDAIAATKIGAAMKNQEGQTAAPYSVFTVASPAPHAFTSSEFGDKKSVEAKVSAQLKLQANQQCKIGGNVDLGVGDTLKQTITFVSELAPSFSEWVHPANNPCCRADGSVSPVCAGLDVIVAVYKTTADIVASTTYNVGGGAQVTCAQASNTGMSGEGSLSVTVGGDHTLTLKSTGWNVVKLESMKNICATLAKK